MAGKTSEHHRGDMDIHEQQRTFHSFIVMSKWGSLILIVGVLFFSLWFAVGTGFLPAAITAFVVTVLGVLALKERKKTAH